MRSSIPVLVEQVKRSRVRHEKRLSIVCQQGAALGINECVIELADLQLTLLHKGLVSSRKRTGDFLSCAAATGHPQSQRRYALYREIYHKSIKVPSFDFFSVLAGIGEQDAESAFLLARRYQRAWRETSNIETLKVAFHWLIVSVQLGFLDALVDLADLFSDLGEVEAALDFWLIASRRGNCRALSNLLRATLSKDLCLMSPNIRGVLRFVKNAERLALEDRNQEAAVWLWSVLGQPNWSYFDLVTAVRMARMGPMPQEPGSKEKILLFGESGPAVATRSWFPFARYLSNSRSCGALEFCWDIVPISGDVVFLACGVFLPVELDDSQGGSTGS